MVKEKKIEGQNIAAAVYAIDVTKILPRKKKPISIDQFIHSFINVNHDINGFHTHTII